MAALIARAKGRGSETTRLGSTTAEASAATWHTIASVTMWADGHGVFELRGDHGDIIAEVDWPAESDARDDAMRAAVIAARALAR